MDHKLKKMTMQIIYTHRHNILYQVNYLFFTQITDFLTTKRNI